VPLDKVNAMIRYKERKASENREAVLTALQDLNKPASVAEITSYLNERAREQAKLDAEIMYNNGELTASERDEYIVKKAPV
jgi:Fe2+ or Zn2+ uptake regulation protein